MNGRTVTSVEGDEQDRLVRAAVPGEDGVHRIGPGWIAHVRKRNGHELLAHCLADELIDVADNLLGALELCPVKRPDAQLKLPGVDARKELGAQTQNEQKRGGAGEKVRAEDEDAPMDDAAHEQLIAALKTPEEAAGVVSRRSIAEQPGGKHWHEGCGQQIACHHREGHRQSERREESATDTDHEERRDKDRENAQHREEVRQHHLSHGVHHGAPALLPLAQVRVNILDRHRGFVDEDADRERQTTKSHDVHGLAHEAQADKRGKKREGDGQNHDERGAPIPQEQEHHQRGEQRSQDALGGEAANGVEHIDRLIEVEVDRDVRRDERPHLRQRSLDTVHDVECRCIGALGDRHVDGSVTIHERDVVQDVGAVFDARDIAQKDRGAASGTQWNVGEVRRFRNHRIRGRDGCEAVHANVAGGQREILLGELGSNVFGRDAIGAHPLRVGIDDDGLHFTARRRWSGNSGDCR